MRRYWLLLFLLILPSCAHPGYQVSPAETRGFAQAQPTIAATIVPAIAPRTAVPIVASPTARTRGPATATATYTSTLPATPSGPDIAYSDTGWINDWGLQIKWGRASRGILRVEILLRNASNDRRPFDLTLFRLHTPEQAILAPRSAAVIPGSGLNDGYVPPRRGFYAYLEFATETPKAASFLTHPALPGLRFVCPAELFIPAPTSARPTLGTPKRYAAAPPMTIDTRKTYIATIKTSMGEITVQLDARAAPATVNNFVFLARDHFYDRLLFHRVIQDFMIQGGDPTGTGTGDPGYRFPDELSSTPYEIGTIAMANGGRNTNGSQFFICEGPRCTALVPEYPQFGKVIAGIDVVHAIAEVKTDARDRPAQEVWIITIEITEK